MFHSSPLEEASPNCRLRGAGRGCSAVSFKLDNGKNKARTRALGFSFSSCDNSSSASNSYWLSWRGASPPAPAQSPSPRRDPAASPGAAPGTSPSLPSPHAPRPKAAAIAAAIAARLRPRQPAEVSRLHKPPVIKSHLILGISAEAGGWNEGSHIRYNGPFRPGICATALWALKVTFFQISGVKEMRGRIKQQKETNRAAFRKAQE